MGLDPVSDSWAAFCFDEACFMWGKHVEHELHKATKKAKNESQAQAKATMAIRRLMTPPEEEVAEEEESGKKIRKEAPPTPSAGRFRDPAAHLKKG